MDISLIKTLFLVFGFLVFGKPDEVHSDYSFSLSISFGGSSGVGASLSVLYDPVFVYNRELPGDLCGLTYVNLVFISPRRNELGCLYTFEHEMAHVWQYREWGLLSFPLYFLFEEDWEPEDGYKRVPYHNRNMNYPLIRIVIPISSPVPLEK